MMRLLNPFAIANVLKTEADAAGFTSRFLAAMYQDTDEIMRMANFNKWAYWAAEGWSRPSRPRVELRPAQAKLRWEAPAP